jgi:hypothetical protein
MGGHAVVQAKEPGAGLGGSDDEDDDELLAAVAAPGAALAAVLGRAASEEAEEEGDQDGVDDYEAQAGWDGEEEEEEGQFEYGEDDEQEEGRLAAQAVGFALTSASAPGRKGVRSYQPLLPSKQPAAKPAKQRGGQAPKQPRAPRQPKPPPQRKGRKSRAAAQQEAAEQAAAAAASAEEEEEPPPRPPTKLEAIREALGANRELQGRLRRLLASANRAIDRNATVLLQVRTAAAWCCCLPVLLLTQPCLSARLPGTGASTPPSPHCPAWPARRRVASAGAGAACQEECRTGSGDPAVPRRALAAAGAHRQQLVLGRRTRQRAPAAQPRCPSPAAALQAPAL